MEISTGIATSITVRKFAIPIKFTFGNKKFHHRDTEERRFLIYLRSSVSLW